MYPSVSVVLLPFLCSALLCGVLDVSSQEAGNATTPMPSNTTAPGPSTPGVPGTTPGVPGTTPNSNWTTPNSNWTTPGSSDPTTEATPAPAQGLSDGAIAGIVIGSIAGAGLVGGGIYGLLKYTGKI
ncbi:unnamed protein product [Knipowitschia caucasica]